MSTCPVVMPKTSKRVGEVCGASVVGFVAPGAGRCGWHYQRSERVRVLSERRALRDMRELRGLEPEDRQPEDEPESCVDDEPKPSIRFDSDRFASAEFDE